MMRLPAEFSQTIRNTFSANGEVWLSALPDLIAEACHLWELTDIQPVPNLSYKFVASALQGPHRGSGASDIEHSRSARFSNTGFDELNPPLRTETILKLGVPNRELSSEIAALRYYIGRGACRLLDADAEKGMLLLERLQPGRMLSTLTDDERAIRIAAEVMRQLWRPVPENRNDFIQLKDWFDGFKRLRRRYKGKTGPLPKQFVETAESLSRELLSENKDETLLHGDFHHLNVLESERGWLAIDPKGVIGPRRYEVGPLLINPVPDFLNGNSPRVQTEKRIAILSEILGMNRESLRSWSFCHAVLSAWWSIEDNHPGMGKYSIRCAELFLQS